MSGIQWDESFSTNNPEIDAQHKKWINMYNELHETLLHGNMKQLSQITLETLQSIQDYAHYHFSFEEEYMKSINYPNIVEHKRLHKDFDTQIYELNRDVREGRTVLGTKIIKIMKNWIIDHILNADKQYAEFVQGN